MTAEADDLFAGRFALAAEVGRGASGVVYRALDVASGEQAAVKLIADTSSTPEDRERFLAEGEVLSTVEHPNIVHVLAYGTLEVGYADAHGHRAPAGTPYVAMEWLEGEDLGARQRRSPLSLRAAVDVIRQVAEALDCAHTAKIVHRDVKPSNIFLLDASALGADGQSATLRSSALLAARAGLHAKLLDFGVAAAGDTSLAGAGAIVGTPAYMAPEQAQGDAAPDARSDLFALGAVLYELCAGRPPHAAPTSIATLARRVTGPAPRLSEALLEVPASLDELVAQLLEAEPSRRPASARVVADRLAALGESAELARVEKLVLREDDSRARLGTRLVTTLVALGVATGEIRAAELARIRALGADALPLGADSIVVHLGARQAHGDEAQRAIDLGRELAQRGGRVGIATGRTRVDLTRSSGDIVDRAAKLAKSADDGRVALDDVTEDLSRGRFEFEIPSADVSMMVASQRRRQIASSSFVGREAELALAQSAFERCVDDRTPIVVTVTGPPGIGKSRLGQEILTRLEQRDSDSPRLMFVRCESYATSLALGTASDALRSLLQLPKGASFDEAVAAIAGASGAGREPTDEAPLLAYLLSNEPFPKGVEPQAARDALYVSMTELVLDVAGRGPCALVVEDAQWADAESVAWIDHLLGRAQSRPLFAMLLVRPTFWRSASPRFATRDHVRIELKPMPRRAVRSIARGLLGDKATEEQLDQVADQAAGSPLFAEELARLVSRGRGLVAASTIEAAIQVSLDALDDPSRDAIGRLSIFGMTGWDRGLEALGVTGAAPVLPRLIAADLLVEQSKSRFAGTQEYLFKHALVRDVAYAMVGDELKKDLHARAAEWLADEGEGAATIAHHYDLGGRHEDAAEHWEAAARRALATGSLAEAASMSERALAFADDRPSAFARARILEEAQARLDARGSERDTAIQSMRENTFDEASELRTEGAAARYDDARGQGHGIEERLRSVRDRATSLGLLEEAARCAATLAQRCAFAGDFNAAEREASNLLELADREELEWAAVDAWQTLAIVCQTRGELAAALDARRNAARAARKAGLWEREAILTVNLGFALTTLGARNEALMEIETGLAKAHAVGSVGAVRHGQMNLLGWAATFGADARVSALLTEPRAQADEAAAGAYVIQDRSTLGILFYRGLELLRSEGANLQRAKSLLERVAQAYRTTGNLDLLPVTLGFWSEAERRSGNTAEARTLAEEAASLLDCGAPSLLNEAPVYLALHDACVDAGDLQGARGAIERGMPHLLRRLAGLEDTPYAHAYLTGLPHNAGLLEAAEAYGLVPEAIERVLARH